MTDGQRRVRMVMGLLFGFLMTFILSRTVFPYSSPQISTAFLSGTIPALSFSFPSFPVFTSQNRTSLHEVEPSLTFALPTVLHTNPTEPMSTSTPRNNPTNTPIPNNNSIPTIRPSRTPTPSRVPTQPSNNAPTLCGQSPTFIPSWGDDAPYFEVCVYDSSMSPVPMKKLCRAVCKSDNCTESICIINGSYGKFNRGGPHSGYTGYGVKMSLDDVKGKKRTVVEVRPNVIGSLEDCVSIGGKCYLWDYIKSGIRSVSIIVSP